MVDGKITNAAFLAEDNGGNGRALTLNGDLATPCCSILDNELSFDNHQTFIGNEGGFTALNPCILLPPFRFSFENIEGNVAGSVTGVISGLVDNQDGQIASSVTLTSWPETLPGNAPLDLDATTWITPASLNSFEVENGQIVDIFFGGQEPGNAMFLNASLQSDCCGVLNNFLSFDPANSSTGNNGGFSEISFSQPFATKPATAPTVLSSIAASLQLEKVIATNGNSSTARFTAGASSDNGETTGSAFLVDDDLVVAATAFPQADDIGKTADIYVVLQTIINGVRTFYYRDLDANFQPWSGCARDLDAAYESSSLQSQESFSVYEGQWEAGIYRIYVAYMVEDATFLHFNSRGLRIEISE